MSEIKMYKLVSSEFVIGKLVDGDTDSIGIDTPMCVHFQPAPNGQLGINLFPMNPFANQTDEAIKFKNDHIMFEIAEVHPDILNQYSEITSGITIPTKGDVAVPNMELVTP